MTERRVLSDAFLTKSGWGTAQRRFLAGDASDRSYDRLVIGAKTAVLMDAPLGKGDDPAVFLTIARRLIGLGLSAPLCFGADVENGFLLLEDLGDDLFARLVAETPSLEGPLYRAATDVLVTLQHHPLPTDLPNATAADWARAACFALDWYRFAITGDRCDTAEFHSALEDTITQYADGPRVMILRDYHAENLLWLPNRIGVARVGLLDFQLAQQGQPGYDLVSLLQDARRDVSRETEASMIRHFKEKTGADSRFDQAYAVLGAQRSLRILGVFARLCLVAGKPSYLKLLPRVWGQLQNNLAHPVNAPLARICDTLLPPPSPKALSRIGDQCATSP